MKTNFVAGFQHPPGCVNSCMWRRRAMFTGGKHPHWRKAPRNQRAATWLEREQVVDLISFGLELEQQVLMLGEIADQIAADTGERVERERISQFSGADAEGASRTTARETIEFFECVVVIGENLEARIIGKVLLEEAVAAIHRTIRRQYQHQVAATGELR